jgi:PBSX family phage terminase large subunit
MDERLPTIDLPKYAKDLWQPFRHLAWHGGRGGGKSRTVATGLVLQSCERHERILCGREFQKSIRDSSKRLIDDEIDRLGLRGAFQSTETEIRGPHDSLFLFSGVRGNASALKSTEGITVFWGDEAQAFSQSSIDTIIPTIRKPDSRLIWTWNPDLPSDPVDALFRGNNAENDARDNFTPPPKSIVREINYPDNRWFPEVLQTEMEFVRSRDIDNFPRIAPALKGARSVEEGIEFLKSYDMIVHPRCAHLIDELTHYSYKVDSLTGQVTAILADKDNHMIDAMRYAVEGARRALSSKPAHNTMTVRIPSLALRR